jgi:hypothetical protein
MRKRIWNLLSSWSNIYPISVIYLFKLIILILKIIKITVTLSVYQMKSAFAEYAELYAIVTMPVVKAIFVKTEYVNKVVVMTMHVISTKLV